MGLPLVSSGDDDECDGGHLYGEWEDAHQLEIAAGVRGSVIVKRLKYRECRLSDCNKRKYELFHFAGPIDQVEFEEALKELEETEE